MDYAHLCFVEASPKMAAKTSLGSAAVRSRIANKLIC